MLPLKSTRKPRLTGVGLVPEINDRSLAGPSRSRMKSVAFSVVTGLPRVVRTVTDRVTRLTLDRNVGRASCASSDADAAAARITGRAKIPSHASLYFNFLANSQIAWSGPRIMRIFRGIHR